MSSARKFDFSDLPPLPGSPQAAATPTSRFDFSDLPPLPGARPPVPEPTEPYPYGTAGLAAAGESIGNLIDFLSMGLQARGAAAQQAMPGLTVEPGKQPNEPFLFGPTIGKAIREAGGGREAFYPGEKIFEKGIGAATAGAPNPLLMLLAGGGAAAGEAARQYLPEQYSEFLAPALEYGPILGKLVYDLRNVPKAFMEKYFPTSGAREFTRTARQMGESGQLALEELGGQAVTRAETATRAAQAAQNALRVAEEAASEAGLRAARLPRTAAAFNPTAVTTVRDELVASNAPQSLLAEYDAASKQLTSGNEAARRSFLDGINRDFQLRTADGTKTPRIRNAYETAAQHIRTAEREGMRSFRPRYQEWDQLFGDQGVLMYGTEAADTLVRDIRNVVSTVRGNAQQLGLEAAATALGTVEREHPILRRLLNVEDGLLDVSVRQLRDLRSALYDKVMNTLPGDKQQLFWPIINELTEVITRGVGPEGAAALRTIDADYRMFREKFHDNPYIRPFLKRVPAAERKLGSLLSQEGSQAYAATGGNPALLGEVALYDATKTPDGLVTKLQDQPWIAESLGPRGKALLQQAQALPNVTSQRDLVAASRRLIRSLRDATPAQAEVIQTQLDALIEQLPPRSSARQQLRKAVDTEAKAIRTKAAAELAAQAVPVAEKAAEQATAFARDVQDATTPNQLRSLQRQAMRTGGAAERAFADAALDKLFRGADTPLEIFQRMRENRPLVESLVGKSRYASLQRLLEAEPRITAALESAPVQRVLSELIPQAQGAIKPGGLTAFAKNVLYRSLIRRGLTGGSISRQIDTILRGSPERASSIIAEILKTDAASDIRALTLPAITSP